MSYLRYLFVAHSGISDISHCVFALFFFVLCALCCQFLWIVHFVIAPSVYLTLNCSCSTSVTRRATGRRFDQMIYNSFGTLCSLPSLITMTPQFSSFLISRTLYQRHHAMNHKFWNIGSTERAAGMMLHLNDNFQKVKLISSLCSKLRSLLALTGNI